MNPEPTAAIPYRQALYDALSLVAQGKVERCAGTGRQRNAYRYFVRRLDRDAQEATAQEANAFKTLWTERLIFMSGAHPVFLAQVAEGKGEDTLNAWSAHRAREAGQR